LYYILYEKECNTVIAWVMFKRVNGTNKDLIPTFRFKSGTSIYIQG
jgi:hypothetical protein